MRIKLISTIIIFTFLSCEDNIIKEYYPNGNLKSEISVDEEKNSFRAYYETGELKSEGNYIDGFIKEKEFYKNGNIKEEGVKKKGLKVEWWSYYDNTGKFTHKEEYTVINDTSHLNQKIFLNVNGEIDSLKSFFFKIEIPDTLYIGKNIGKITKYNSINNGEHTLISVLVENEYAINKIKTDTFSNGTLKPAFGIYAFKKGHLKVKGKILEQQISEFNINQDSSRLQIEMYERYFEKEVYVKDTIEANFNKRPQKN